MRHIARGLALAAALAACGQSGPLRLPQPPPGAAAGGAEAAGR